MQFNFIIPLKSVYARDKDTWITTQEKSKTVLKNLERTLSSIDQSADHNPNKEIDINIFISSHENPFDPSLPGFLKNNFKNINVFSIENKFGRPEDKSEYMNDKERKKDSAIKEITTRGIKNESYLMFLDADDLLALSFFNTVLDAFKSNNCDDICLMSGYLFNFRDKIPGILNGIDRIFYRNCGSSFISKINALDLDENGFFINCATMSNSQKLPRTMEGEFTTYKPRLHYT